MVAEVASRFEDTRAFLNAMAQLGFKSVSKVRTQACPMLRPREPGSPEKEQPGWGRAGGYSSG